MAVFKLFPKGTTFDFMRWRVVAPAMSVVFIVASVVLLFVQGLNFGIDFRGGILMQIRTPGPTEIADLRDTLGGLGLGEVQLQEFGAENDVLIRIARQEGDQTAQLAAIEKVKGALGDEVDYRQTEYVGPVVGAELVRGGIYAVMAAFLVMLVYIWFRFEWQFGIGALLALVHDVMLTVGVFSLFQFEFNLTTVAAVLTIVGYSINDTVVIYDRIRENLRKYKTMDLMELLNLSVNDTLSRTILTGSATLLALFALFFVGGDTLRGFSFAIIFGIVVGTYSSIYVGVPVLLYMNLRRSGAMVGDGEATADRRS